MGDAVPSRLCAAAWPGDPPRANPPSPTRRGSPDRAALLALLVALWCTTRGSRARSLGGRSLGGRFLGDKEVAKFLEETDCLAVGLGPRHGARLRLRAPPWQKHEAAEFKASSRSMTFA